MEEEDNKLTLKRVELSLSKFNDIAIPHHLDLLRQHKANILKYERAGSVERAGTEAVRARRVATQLRALLAELKPLRAQLAAADRPRFDALTQRSRDLTMSAIADYLGDLDGSHSSMFNVFDFDEKGAMIPMKRTATKEASIAASVVSTDSVGVVRDEERDQMEQMLQDQQRSEASKRTLNNLRDLETELGALTDAWRMLGAQAATQRVAVDSVAESVAVASDNVHEGQAALRSAERLHWRSLKLGATGAVVGGLVAGPLGFAIGLKAGAAATLAGSCLGFLGSIKLTKTMQDNKDVSQGNKDNLQDKKND